MSQATNMFFSMMGQKCPQCRRGKMFVSWPYNLKKFADMNETCSECGQDFLQEPSFYYGAMYVSYAFQVALIVAVAVALNVLYPEAGLEWYIGGVVVSIVILLPIVFRVSRSIWLHFFVRYKREL